MTYQETLDFLYEQLPQYQNIGGKAYKADLSNITELCNLLENPQHRIKTIHVAGTNGKGSVCNMLASILQEAGYKVGLFTSPHLVDFRERIRINGNCIPEQTVIDFVEQFSNEFKQISPSFFEWSTALSFYHFSKEHVDIAIIETGLGGRLDSTNIITPEISIITSIGIDHTAFLGDTIDEIAFEKAGIIKPNIPVVIGPQIKYTRHVFEKKAKENGAPLFVSSNKKEIKTSLSGKYQQYNISTVITAIEHLNQFKIESNHITNGLLNVQKNTGLRGRWETLQENPKVICDIGHNDHAVQEITEQLIETSKKKLHIIWGMVSDKKIDKVVELLPKNATYYLVQPNIPRAMPVEELGNYFSDFEKKQTFSSCSEAFKNALNIAEKDDLIFVGGSTFVVSEIISEFFQ